MLVSKGGFRHVLASVGVVVLALGLLATLAGLGARWNGRLELLTHFKVQLTVAVLVGLVLLLFARRWRGSAVAGLLLGWHLIEIIPFYWPTSRVADLQGSGPVVKALYANVHCEDRNARPLLELVQSQQPDVVVFAEATPGWMNLVKSLDTDYPHQVAELRDDPFSISLLSKWPITQHSIHYAKRTQFPTIIATISVNDRSLTVIGTHPPPPFSRRQLDSDRDVQIRELAALARQHSGPLVLLGDLNCTSWSPVFTDLLRDSGLRDARIGFGIQPSWPDSTWLLRIPIDHTLVSKDLGVKDRQLGSPIVSDHRPVIVEVQFAESR